jgi:hypothetical protein
MDIFRREDLFRLARERARACVSIYLPVQRTGRETLQNTTRMQNLLGQAQDLLQARGHAPKDARVLLETIAQRAQNTYFWEGRSDGLCVFVSPSMTAAYHLPFTFEERVDVDSCFIIRPLLLAAAAEMPFFVICISHRGARLLKGNRYGIAEVEVNGMPRMLEFAEMIETRPPGAARRMPRSFPQTYVGQEAGLHENKPVYYAADFMHTVDRIIRGAVDHSDTPLVFAGLEPQFGLYRHANTYPQLVETHIDGNTEIMSEEEIQMRALDAVAPYHQHTQNNALSLAERLLQRKHPRATGDAEKVVVSAFHGRVGTLFVAIDGEQRGTFDPEHSSVKLTPADSSAGRDLVNLATVFTLDNGGTVYATPRRVMPADTPMVAVLRY